MTINEIDKNKAFGIPFCKKTAKRCIMNNFKRYKEEEDEN